MNRTTKLILAVSVAALGCHKAPVSSMTQTTSATQPTGVDQAEADQAGMNSAGAYGYGDPNGNDNGRNGPPDQRQLDQMNQDRRGETTQAARDYDRSGAGAPESDKRSFQDTEPVVTPINQADDQADLDVAQAVHSAIRSDDYLAAAAKSVDITTNDGIVTLRGHVASVDDKKAIEARAQTTAGVNRVDDEITIVPHPTF